MSYHLEIRGAFTGAIWWPVGQPCGMDLADDLSRRIERMGGYDDKPTLRELLLSVLMEKGGDFQSASFTEDTGILVRSDKGTTDRTHRVRTRYWPITAFPSVRDLVAEGVLSSDFHGED